MLVLHFVVGVAAFGVGMFGVVRREAIVARYQRRSGGRAVQPPMAYLLVGVILMLVGVAQIIEAFV